MADSRHPSSLSLEFSGGLICCGFCRGPEAERVLITAVLCQSGHSWGRSAGNVAVRSGPAMTKQISLSGPFSLRTSD